MYSRSVEKFQYTIISPLHLAAALNNLEMVEVLLRNGANVNIETAKERQTPVHYAAKYNSLDALKLLIKYSGSITKRDYKVCFIEGKT